MRITCAFSTAGCRKRPLRRRRAATPHPACCSTGNTRAAKPVRTRSPATEVRPGAAGWSRSMRYRKFGDTRTASQRGRDSLLKRIALLARQGDVSEVLFHFPGGVAGRRNARAAKLAKIVRAHASVCFPGSVAADVDPAQALGRRPRRLIERTADIDRLRTGCPRGFRRASVLIFVPYLRSVSMSFSVSLPRGLISGSGGRLEGSGPL